MRKREMGNKGFYYQRLVVEMKIEKKDPPRKYLVGSEYKIEITDCGKIYLDSNEQVTFVTPSGKKHDFVAKDWGFYATPSINSRLKNEGFKTALVKNKHGKYYIMIIEKEKIKDFEIYLKKEKSKVKKWLDEL